MGDGRCAGRRAASETGDLVSSARFAAGSAASCPSSLRSSAAPGLCSEGELPIGWVLAAQSAGRSEGIWSGTVGSVIGKKGTTWMPDSEEGGDAGQTHNSDGQECKHRETATPSTTADNSPHLSAIVVPRKPRASSPIQQDLSDPPLLSRRASVLVLVY